jgi:GT2 family glycosyltransferase
LVIFCVFCVALQISVIIVNYNVKYFLEQCLHSVFKALKGIDGEVFVVDNNSVDGSVAVVKEKFPQVKLIENHHNTGFSVANNQAMKLSSGKYLLLLNPDTIVQEDTFSKVITFMDEHPDAGGLGIKMVDGKGNFLPESKRGLPTPAVAFYKIFGLSKLFPNSKRYGQYHLTFLDKNKNQQVDILSGAFMLMRKSVLDKIGLLDETFFMYGEDVDLSYRITQAGYKNYYFAESSIIHYKGESTKKSSVNYVIVFYKAMAIFAKKHFSKNGAGIFIFLIYMAIYLRAFAAIITRLIKQLFFPAIDFALVLLVLYFLKTIYEQNFKLYPNFYSRSIINIAFPVYTLLWMFFVYLSGGYDYPVKLRRIIRGVITGSAFILIVYSLLPEYYRFSRALILMGTASTVIVFLILRLLYHLAGIKRFRLNPSEIEKRIAIIGSAEEFKRVSDILARTSLKARFIGFVSLKEGEESHKAFIGNFDQIDEVIEFHRINEVIFCARDVSSQNIIGKMLSLVAKNLEFKIAPPESLSIIGSNSIDTAGELYVIDLNNVARPENKRKKRLLDILTAFLLLLCFPLLMCFQKHPFGFIRNCIKVLLGLNTWIGYGKTPRKDLPALKPSVITPATNLLIETDAENFNRLLLNYSKEYVPENDLRIMWRAFTNLGN